MTNQTMGIPEEPKLLKTLRDRSVEWLNTQV